MDIFDFITARAGEINGRELCAAFQRAAEYSLENLVGHTIAIECGSRQICGHIRIIEPFMIFVDTAMATSSHLYVSFHREISGEGYIEIIYGDGDDEVAAIRAENLMFSFPEIQRAAAIMNSYRAPKYEGTPRTRRKKCRI